MIDLEAIRARNAARTQGNWEYYNRYGDRGFVLLAGSEEVAITDTDLADPGMTYACVRKCDGEFIAACSEDVPALLAEIARLRAALEAAKAAVARLPVDGDDEQPVIAAIDKALRGEP